MSGPWGPFIICSCKPFRLEKPFAIVPWHKKAIGMGRCGE